MDSSLSFLLKTRHYCYQWANLIVILLTIQSLTLPGGNTALVALNVTLSSGLSYQQIPVPQLLLKPSQLEHVVCDGCKIGENGKLCSGSDQGVCDCHSGNVICRCKDEWAGDVCQYKIAKISCEKMRNCILCQVHGSGPLAEGKDCDYFCHYNYPTPLIVKTLHFQEDEHLCSFIHDSDDAAECRYFFKYGQINPDGSLESANFYIVAQQEMSCEKPAKFPALRPNSKRSRDNETFQLFSENYEEVKRNSDNHGADELKRKNSFFTVVIIFVFVALPFVTCLFSLIYNFPTLPCGLCNMFRQSSSKYLRNVRPFPGFVPAEETTAV